MVWWYCAFAKLSTIKGTLAVSSTETILRIYLPYFQSLLFTIFLVDYYFSNVDATKMRSKNRALLSLHECARRNMKMALLLFSNICSFVTYTFVVSSFSVGDESELFRVQFSGHTGRAGDSMNPDTVHAQTNNQPFTTVNRDNGQWVGTAVCTRFAILLYSIFVISKMCTCSTSWDKKSTNSLP